MTMPVSSASENLVEQHMPELADRHRLVKLWKWELLQLCNEIQHSFHNDQHCVCILKSPMFYLYHVFYGFIIVKSWERNNGMDVNYKKIKSKINIKLALRIDEC